MSNIKPTRKAYEEYLNDLSQDLDDDNYIVAGKNYLAWKYKNKYGSLLRQKDEIAFNAGYYDWKLTFNENNTGK